MSASVHRCAWTQNEPYNIAYHDTEWGVPVHDDRKLFEFMLLDAFQAGLSWLTILKKREAFRLAFDMFDYEKIANYDEAKIAALMQNPGLVRNKAKMEASVSNAQAFIRIREEFGTFDRYIWQFTGHKTIMNTWNHWKDLPASTPESVAMAKDLKKRGFRFAGPTICYAFMQAAGMVNDHEMSCFRYQEINYTPASLSGQ